MSLYYEDDRVRIYRQDNLELLRELPAGSINLIYCDILYNTGKVFDDYSDDLVADFFLGGGTTAVVAQKLGRRFLGCDISEKACEITVKKLEGKKEEV